MRRPNGTASAAVIARLIGVFDQLEGIVIADDEGERCVVREAIGEDDGAGARPTAAMRRRERLVQVDVHGIDAEVAGADLADDGVEVGAIAIEVGAGLVDSVRDSTNVRLEQAAGVGVGEHDRGDVRAKRLAHGFDSDRAIGPRLQIERTE